MASSSKRTKKNTRIGGRTGKEIAGLYDLEDTIGEGHFAVVKMARHVFTGERVAVKVIDKLKFDSSTRVQTLQEVRLMKLVQHPNVVRLYEVIDTPSKLYLILELADGGDLYDYIMKHEQGLTETLAKKYFRQIVNAIQYCHKLHVVHRDLKPENASGQSLQTSCGSLAYSAPEILLGDAYDAPAVDIWSLGVILYMLVCGAAPFQEANDSETLTMIMDCKYTFPKHISSQCKKLISSMLQRNPMHRACLDEIILHPWLDEVKNVDSVPEWEQLPLVSREHLSEEEHAYIINKMVNGGVGIKEEIIEALDRDDYNHITATYFLLAERKLRAQRHDLIKKTNSKEVDMTASFPLTPTRNIVEASRKTVQASCSTVESLLSPEDKQGFSSTGKSYRIRQFVASSLHLTLETDKSLIEAPAPFPVTSQIGTGSLSRQGSLRRSSGSSPCSERKSAPESPDTDNSLGSSPARYSSKLNCQSRKVPIVKSSPQHTQSGPVLNQIHEEEAEVDQFPSKFSSATVMRRFEQRRLAHKSRTQSCSSSEASDDDSEKKRYDKRTPPPKDDDNTDPGGSSGAGGFNNSSSGGSGNNFGDDMGRGSTRRGSEGSGTGGSGGGRGLPSKADDVNSNRRHRHQSRLRQSHSLNRISELHEADFASSPSIGPSIYVRNDSLRSSSRDDSSHNSSDGELEPPTHSGSKSRVNMRILEQKLNKIQEESNNNIHKNAGSEHKFGMKDSLKTIDKVAIENEINNQKNDASSRPLHRAHSCSSLLTLKERAMIRKKLGSQILELIGKDVGNRKSGVSKQDGLLPINSFLSLPNASRCCSLC
ncbi:SNRK [Lepeophtheirus salmonis]|uniref:non-specific serine/threonine protein kinase n=1 Tax=Lepeophtheirus salmonis TaxID=72036 RepID=A0A7R8D6E1_LEPSM|nr:SNRK [Lepeophtheirus salmonis]CAF3015277.1 SNRK [Lepeophtheirus salmonis]